ncbi:hypothetical protein JOE11_000001 [Robbsia andropogonis]|uniref:hypothetical protein n=1 Tax=Robbsia andropogonis TaxID=28092 RepID=UPI003D1C2C8A
MLFFFLLLRSRGGDMSEGLDVIVPLAVVLRTLQLLKDVEAFATVAFSGGLISLLPDTAKFSGTSLESVLMEVAVLHASLSCELEFQGAVLPSQSAAMGM